VPSNIIGQFTDAVTGLAASRAAEKANLVTATRDESQWRASRERNARNVAMRPPYSASFIISAHSRSGYSRSSRRANSRLFIGTWTLLARYLAGNSGFPGSQLERRSWTKIERGSSRCSSGRNRHFRGESAQTARNVLRRVQHDEGNTCDAHVRGRTCVPYACTGGAGGKQEGGSTEGDREREREREREMQAPPFARGIFSATYKSPLCSATSMVARAHARALVYGACYK